MIACTEDLLYAANDAGRQRLSFLVRTPIDPDGLPPLFPTDGELGVAMPTAFGDANGDGVPFPAEPIS